MSILAISVSHRSTSMARLAALAMDRLELRRASLSLREGEERFRSLFDNMRGIIFARGVAGEGPHGYDEDGPRVHGGHDIDMPGQAVPGGRAEIAAWRQDVAAWRAATPTISTARPAGALTSSARSNGTGEKSKGGYAYVSERSRKHSAAGMKGG